MNRNQLLIWLILGVAAFGVAFAPFPDLSSPPIEKNFRIEANQYSFIPAEIQVNPGDRVTIELVSTDVVHGLYIDGYDVSLEADPGQSARLEFTADREGSFRMRCNVTCGAMHPFMIGKIQVGRNSLLWRAVGLAGISVLGAMAFFHIQLSPRSLKEDL